MNVLVVDVGGTHVKVLASGQTEPRKFDSGPTLTPRRKVSGVQRIAGDWSYDAVGKRKWQRNVAKVVAYLTAALEPDDVVLGGGNVKQLEKLPPGCRAGDNTIAFIGGFRLWEDDAGDQRTNRPPAPSKPIHIHKSSQGTGAWQQ